MGKPETTAWMRLDPKGLFNASNVVNGQFDNIMPNVVRFMGGVQVMNLEVGTPIIIEQNGNNDLYQVIAVDLATKQILAAALLEGYSLAIRRRP